MILLKRAAHQMMSITLLQHHMSPQQVEREHVDVNEAVAQLDVLLVQQALTLWGMDLVTAEDVVMVYDMMTAEDVVMDVAIPEGPALAEEVVVAEDMLQVEAMVLYQVMEEQQA